ncbi:MAG: RecX family transcriptional regulator [Bacteroidaceae bacterium]|nr:RecX family transcriptional regulator [Bacteroidaceae bacterium]
MERQKKELTEEQAFTRLARLCSTTEYCRYDMRRKMAAWLLPEGAEERVLKRLEQERYIDEVRYAHAYVRDKSRHNRWGAKRIELELRRRGITDETIQDALTEITEEQSDETLEGLLRTKLKTVKGKSDYDVFLKLLRFSVGRGFPQDQAHRCLKRIINTEEYP